MSCPPRRWAVERSFARAARFRRLVKNCERYVQTLKGVYLFAFAIILSKQDINLIGGSQQALQP
ncbi:MAG: transposase [Novosphingobium sp.]|nr:transposase [Novosphingobium sp.]